MSSCLHAPTSSRTNLCPGGSVVSRPFAKVSIQIQIKLTITYGQQCRYKVGFAHQYTTSTGSVCHQAPANTISTPLVSRHHNASVSSLFIFVIRDETLRSIVRSPISTTSPPMMSGLTCPQRNQYNRHSRKREEDRKVNGERGGTSPASQSLSRSRSESERNAPW